MLTGFHMGTGDPNTNSDLHSEHLTCQAHLPAQERTQDPVFSNSPRVNIISAVTATVKESEEPSLEDVIKKK